METKPIRGGVSEMTTHIMTVRERRAWVDSPTLVQHCYGTDYLDLALDEEWGGFAVSVLFAKDGMEPVEVDYLGNPVEVPAEMMSEPGLVWPIAVGSMRGRRVVSARCGSPMVVERSGDVDAGAPGEDANARRAVAVPHLSEDGELAWSWGYSNEELPQPMSIAGPQGPAGPAGEQGPRGISVGIVQGAPIDPPQQSTNLVIDASTGDAYEWIDE